LPARRISAQILVAHQFEANWIESRPNDVQKKGKAQGGHFPNRTPCSAAYWFGVIVRRNHRVINQ
jgi:hypothetical protein